MSYDKRKALRKRNLRKSAFIAVCTILYCAVVTGIVSVTIILSADYAVKAKPVSGVVNMMSIRDRQMVFMTVFGAIVFFVIITIVFIALVKYLYKKKFRF